VGDSDLEFDGGTVDFAVAATGVVPFECVKFAALFGATTGFVDCPRELMTADGAPAASAR
jgi:hypothetical protein